MHSIHLSDQAYQEARKRAAQAGFASVDDYVADVLTTEVSAQTEDLDHLFTPERLAHIERAAQDIEDGKFVTSEQVREHFQKKFGQ